MAEQETQIRQENADEAFKNIHGNLGGSAGVMDAVVIAETAAKVIAATAGAEESVAGGGEMMRAERAVSFSVFWDVANKVYKVHDPVVKFPDGSSTTLGQPTFSAATFIVEVTRKNGVYAAAWKLSTAPADSDRIVAVKIFKLENSVVTQYHTGAIIVGGGGGADGLWQFAAGEWSKCPVQIGYNITDVAASLPAPDSAGNYRIAVDLTNDTVTLESGGSQDPDFSNNIVYFHVATFAESNGELTQTWSVGAMPVAYKYV